MGYQSSLHAVALRCLGSAVLAATMANYTATSVSHAQTWDGGGGNDNWSTSLNWIGDAAPLNDGTAAIVFGGTTRLTPIVDTPWSVNSITFSSAPAGVFTLGGSQLTIGAGGISNFINSTVVNNAIVLASPQSWLGNNAITFNGTINLGTNTLTVSGGHFSVFNGAISGTGGITKINSGGLVMTAANTYTGPTTINAGLFALGDGILNGSVAGDITNDADMRYRVASATTQTYAHVISGTGSLTKENNGTLILTGANTYTGSTTISGGTLQLGDGTTNGAVVGNITNNAALTLNNGSAQSYGGVISGGGTLAKVGVGTLTLTGTHTYSGTTTISAGTLQLGDGTSNGSITGNVTNNSALAFNNGSLQSYAGTISGTGSLTKSGTNALTLTGTNIYSGGTNLNGGALTLGSANAIGSAGTISFNGGTLLYSAANATDYSSRFSTAAGQIYEVDTNGQNVTWAGNLTSAGGSLEKGGSGTLTLTGANTYSGLTRLESGVVAVGSAGALGNSGTIRFGGGTLQYTAANTTDYSSRFSNNAGQIFRVDTNGQNVTWGSSLVSPGGGALVKSGTGTLTLLGSSTSLSGTSLLAGTLQYGNGTTNATFSANIANSGAVVINTASATSQSYAGVISGIGSLTKTGGGTLALTGANTHTGGTTISNGTLQLGDGTTNGSVTGNIVNNALLTFSNGSSQTFSNVISGSGSLSKSGSGVLTFTGTNTFAGATTISSGTLRLGDGTTNGSVAGNITNNGALTFDNGSSQTYSASITGNGSLTKTGTGSLTLSGNNNRTGATILDQGMLTLGSAAALGGSGDIIFTGGTLQYSAFNATDYSGRIDSNVGQIHRVDTNGQSVTWATPLTSPNGVLVKSGAGTLTLLGSSLNAGNPQTSITAGTLQLGDGATNGSVGSNISNSGSLVINNASAQTYTRAISGTGSVTKAGAGTLTLTGTNTYSGGTTVFEGAILVDDGSTSFGALDFIGGSIAVDGGAANIASFVNTGGTLSFSSGAVTYGGTSGASVTEAGLVLNATTGSPLLLPNATLDADKILTIANTTTIGALRTLSLHGGTLNTGSLINNGTLDFQSGTLSITGAGGFTIGAGGALGGSVTLGTGTSLAITNELAINAGSNFTLNGGNASAGTLANAGTTIVSGGGLSVTGTLTNVSGGRLFVGNLASFDTPGIVANSAGASIELLGGAARMGGGGALTNSGLILGDGEIAKPTTNAPGGEIRAAAGDRLFFSAVNGANAGKVNLQGGTVEFSQALTNASGGQITGRGTLAVGGTGLNNLGTIAFSSGITDVIGDVVNNSASGSIGVQVSGNADVTFWDDVTNTSGLFRVSAGSSATFFGTYAGGSITGTGDTYFEADVTPGFSPAAISLGGDVTLGAAAELVIELAGTSLGSQYDQVAVGGQFALDGMLSVSLLGGFTPAAGDSFDILNWGTLGGVFSAIQLPALTGNLVWNTDALYTSGVLSVVSAGLPGDYNSDGQVDAADYTIWRDNLGSSVTLPNDPTPGTVSQADYSVWLANFGTTGPSALAPSSVPEPTAAVVLAITVGVFLQVSRQRWAR